MILYVHINYIMFYVHLGSFRYIVIKYDQMISNDIRFALFWNALGLAGG